ncbi:AMP-binding protein [Pimelobacter simplex]|uniref:Acetyl-coenzyme A synthetase n=2 Tax=Nocardioides simplex TaxID=2045 RepID=A0A0A1DR91_NOCSI|nr:AMP-binding protein [Pimelobacter simplex]AIY19122.1 Acetyl-coenzyme A synthetase [Pimelobacter simplex]MCG8149145.1 AMP-binding protein [Pimelobacter simplex]GEB14948.1 AMP-dependent synthetase [Pimelobacter simplex]SFM22932.1 acetyl-CoA synthetase [Pimelobacter simplex]
MSTALGTARDLLRTHRTDRAAAVASFRWPDVGPSFNFVHDWFDGYARDNDQPALVIVEEDGARSSYTFGEMVTRSEQVAAYLAAQGVGRGDAVVVMLGNQVELWESMLALIRLGAVIMPTTTAVGTAELVDRLERGAARAVICNAADVPKFDEVPGAPVRVVVGSSDASGWLPYATAYESAAVPVPHPGNASDDRLLLYFTSGTTSRPKLVEHTHVSYPVGHLSTMYWLGLQAGDVHLNISSPGWAKHAWSNFFAPWLAEATVFVYNYARFDAAALLGQIRAEGVTTFCAPPTVWRMLINADLSGGPGVLREAIAAGEPLNPEVISQVEKHWGLTIRDGFGQTEMTACIANTPGQPVVPGAMGHPLPGMPVVLVDPLTGEVVPGVGEGELCLDLAAHPLPLMTGYQGDPAKNAEAMAGGFYHTGDVASRDADGCITYVGRTDDVFKASDYKISPFELESVLIEHPAVAEAAVVPAPDPVRLAVPKAYIALVPGHTPSAETAESILKYAREHLAPYLRVRRLEFFELPKTISGKIRRVELRHREVDAEASGQRSAGEFRDDDFPGLRG